MSSPAPAPSSSSARARTAPGAAAAYSGLALAAYWLARAFLPVELGNLTADEALVAREALAGVAASSAATVVAFVRRLLARRFPDVLEG
ncbi:MAG: hypothetical protein DCC71_02870 [Proteobacteria bacterium]|nr:MAG: hypothetical protein DCC71_02870 [Pseudomonadota bacterium]